MTHIVMLLLPLLLEASKTSVQAFKSSCIMESIDTSGRLVCTFDVDLLSLRYPFNVLRYDHGQAKPDVVLHCGFQTGYNEPNCTVTPGYTFDAKNISTMIVLGVTELSKAYDGVYSCNLIQSGNTDQYQTCSVFIQERVKEASSRDGDSELDKAIIAIVTAICVAVLIGAGILIWRCRQQRPNETGCTICCIRALEPPVQYSSTNQSDDPTE